MAAHWDRRNTRPILSRHNSYHGQTATFQAPLPEDLGQTRSRNPPIFRYHGRASPFGPPVIGNEIVPIPYYEAYTIRPEDLASSEERWSLPPKKSIPATQEDLHAEVIRQRQSGRTACRELEDCHGPKRQYIDRLISERDASTSLGHFEVAQLRLERIPRDSGKASSRNRSRSYHAREYQHKDSTKARQKTVYMHIVLQFIKNPNGSLAQILPDNLAPRDPHVGNEYRSEMQHRLEKDTFIPLVSSNDLPSVSPRSSRRPTPSREYTYITVDEEKIAPSSSRYTSRGTQTTLPVHIYPRGDCSSADTADDATLGGDPIEETSTTNTNVAEEMLRKSSSSDDEVVTTSDSAAAHEFANDSNDEKESRSIDEYQKPPWFQNLQPGLLLLALQI